MIAQTGTYALIGTCDTHQQVTIGKLGRLRVRPGYYVYIGSAFGPGGLSARIAHHTGVASRPHWHIDYLRTVLCLKEVWYTNDVEHYEHRWAEVLSGLKGATIPITGFGASDCSCTSHLFAFSDQPPIRSFRRRLHTRVHSHGSILQHKLIEGSGHFPDRAAPGIITREIRTNSCVRARSKKTVKMKNSSNPHLCSLHSTL